MVQSKKQVDLSIILTAHNEGILAHKTMLSVFRAIKKLDENRVTYEIIIHIDNGTRETTDYFKRYENDNRIRIFKNKFGDPALSRNFSAENAKGEYISCFDADDLLSENWYIDAYRIVKGSESNIARFNFIVTFGGRNTIITENSDFGNKEILYFIESNLYGSPFMCSKALFLKSPQRRNKSPFSYEDWQWNLDIMSKGGKNVIVPESVIFYRQNPLVKMHVLSQHNSVRSTLSPTEMLAFEYLNSRTDLDDSIYVTEPISSETRLRDLGSKILYHSLVNLNKYKLFRNFKKSLGFKGYQPVPIVPEWLVDEWKDINKIEKLTGPSSYILNNTISWLPDKKFGVDYVRLNRELNTKPDTLFFVPWLVRGGADKVFINTANEIAKQNPSWSVAVIQTLVAKSLWRDRLNKNVEFVDLVNILSDLDYESQMRLMAMFVSQNRIKRIIIGNSKFAYDFILRYKSLVRQLDLKVYVYAFAGQLDEAGLMSGYVHEEIPLIDDVIYKIITDNSQISRVIEHDHAIRASKFYTHYQFISDEYVSPRGESKDKLNVLWASRITKSKLPEVAKDIALGLGVEDYKVDVYGELEDNYDRSFFYNSNLNYIRRFDGIDDLPIDDYDIFLYTSNADGMPNMLLEVGSRGLPIVAPNVGGIKDLIKDGKTGLLIEDCYDVEAYVNALRRLKDESLRFNLAKNNQSLLRAEFSRANWENGIKEIFDK